MQLAPTLEKGDVASFSTTSPLPYKSPVAEKAIRARGAWLLFLPPDSPDLNPIEMAFAKLKAHLRKRAILNIDALLGGHRRHLPTVLTRRMPNYFNTADRNGAVDAIRVHTNPA